MAYEDPSTIEDPGDDGTGRVTLSRDQIRSMERDAKAARQAQRELAFVKAGIDTDSDLGRLFSTAYEGELDREAIQAAWAKIAPAPAPPTDPVTEPPPSASTDPAAAEFEEERRRLAQGGAGDDGTPPDRDPRKTAIEAGHKMMAEGHSRDEAMAQAFSDLASAAAAGDGRVIYTP